MASPTQLSKQCNADMRAAFATLQGWISIVLAAAILLLHWYLVDLGRLFVVVGLLFALVYFAVVVNISVALWRVVAPFLARPARPPASAARGALLLALAPVVLDVGSRHLGVGFASYVLRSRAVLDEAVRLRPAPSDEQFRTPDGFEVLPARVAGVTVVRTGSFGVIRSLWLIHSPSGCPTHSHMRAAFEPYGLERYPMPQHAWGAWYALIQ
jgi:hypothetical protein